MKTFLRISLASVLLNVCGLASAPALAGMDSACSHYIITVTDDFIVNAYLNGKEIPDSKRELAGEIFGATVERIHVDVHPGDWLVFNVVNDRMRWGGCYYFAAAGCLEKDNFGFVSELKSGNWTACDNSEEVSSFISEKNDAAGHPAQKITNPWSDGARLMHQFAGNSWNGTPIWGTSRNTWLKYNVP